MTVGAFLYLIFTISLGANWIALLLSVITKETLFSALAFVLQSLTAGSYLIVGISDEATMQQRLFQRRNRK